VQVHFPDKSMVWILHAGHWVVRLCWRHCFEPRSWIKGVQGRAHASDASDDTLKHHVSQQARHPQEARHTLSKSVHEEIYVGSQFAG